MKAPPEACFTCGSPVEPGQEYCLQCGERVVPARRPGTVGRAWERRFGRYPGDWIWASLVLLLVAAGSATAGIVAARDTRSAGGSETVLATSPIVTAPPAPPAPAFQPQPKAQTVPTPAPAPSARNVLTEWPPQDGYTVVLASIPARGTGLDDANAKAKAALAGGLHDVGVIASGRFASLHPGYYVIFAGVYRSLQDAQAAAGKISSKFPNAYARQITR